MPLLVSHPAVSTTPAKPPTARSWRLRTRCWTAPVVGGTMVPSATWAARRATFCKSSGTMISARARFVLLVLQGGMSKWRWRSGEITQPRAQNLSSALGQDLIQIFRFRIGAVWLWNEVLIVRNSYVLSKPKDFQPKMFKCVFRPSPSSLALPSQTGFLGLFFWRCGVCFLHNQFLGKVPHVYS